MSGIRQVNKNEVNLLPMGASNPPDTITANDVVLYRVAAPADGTVEALTATVGVAGSGGTTLDQGIQVFNGGYDGTGTTVIAGPVLTTTQNVHLAAGSHVEALGNKSIVRKGQILIIAGHEAGTPGTDDQVNITGLIFRSFDHLDPAKHIYD
jgi:hypothetical protein